MRQKPHHEVEYIVTSGVILAPLGSEKNNTDKKFNTHFGTHLQVVSNGQGYSVFEFDTDES